MWNNNEGPTSIKVLFSFVRLYYMWNKKYIDLMGLHMVRLYLGKIGY